MKKLLKTIVCTGLFAFCMTGPASDLPGQVQAANPYLPLWEHIPDGEPHIFEDPETGEERLYVYGSHDTLKSEYCGLDLVAWSAPLDDLNDWRYDGVIFESIVDGEPDVLYAPDVALVEDEDGNKTYYLYPNNQAGGRTTMVAKSDSPTGPFQACNWKPGSTTETEGCFGFDPAVLVDDDGRVYGYWGFQGSYAAELDPETMSSVKPGTEIVENMIPSWNAGDDNDFRFFEASSIRKIQADDPSNPSGKDRYIFIYSRWSKDGEFGLYGTNSTLAYAYSDHPLGPWTYGGTLVDARARDVDENGSIITTLPPNNTHGSLVEVDDQWWLFYHRCASGGFARQAMADPVEMTIDADGTVHITEAEVTSQGFEIDGLDPFTRYSAGISCYLRNGSGVAAAYDQEEDSNPVVGNRNGSIVGFKYYNFDGDVPEGYVTSLSLEVVPKGTAGTIKVMLDRPWEAADGKDGGTVIGEIQVPARSDGKRVELKTTLPALSAVDGKHGVYLVFESDGGGEICDLHYLQFSETVDYINADTSEDEWEILSGEPVISDGAISLSDGDALQALNGGAWEDYIVSADVSVQSGELGIQVRKEDGLNYYTVNVKEDRLELVSVENGRERVLGRAALTELSDISVNCVGDAISVRANGSVVLSVRDDSHRTGTVGFTSEGTSSVKNILVQNSAQADSIQRTDTITIDGQPLEGYQVDRYEYTVITDGSRIPEVAASSTDPSVTVVVSSPEEVPGTAIVQFTGSVSRTYYIHLNVMSDVQTETVDWGTSLPDGWQIDNPGEGTVTFNGNTVTITAKAGDDFPDSNDLLTRTEGLEGDWTVTVKAESDNQISQMPDYAQIGMSVLQNDRYVGKLDVEKNWGAQAVATFLVPGSYGNQTAVGNQWNHWLRIEKTGTTIHGYVSTDGENFNEIGSLMVEADVPCRIQLYATPQAGPDLVVTFSDLTISSYKGGSDVDASEEAKADVEAVQNMANQLKKGVLIPAGEYDSVDARKAAALESLSGLYEGADFAFGGEDQYLSLTITKGQASSTIQPVRLLEEHSYADLQELIGKAQAVKAIDYTQESYERLENALEKGLAVSADSDAYAIAQAYETLAGSMEALAPSENVDTDIALLTDGGYTSEPLIQVVVTEGSGQDLEKLTIYKDGKEVKSYDRSEASKVSGRNYTFDIDFDQTGFGDGEYRFEAIVSGTGYEVSVVSDRTLPVIRFDEKTGTVTVTDANLGSVALDGREAERTFTLSDYDLHRVQASDLAGNTAMLEVQRKQVETPDPGTGSQGGTSDTKPGQSGGQSGSDQPGVSKGNPSEDTPAAVQTGDKTYAGVWAVFATAAFACIAGLAGSRVRRNRKEK